MTEKQEEKFSIEENSSKFDSFLVLHNIDNSPVKHADKFQKELSCHPQNQTAVREIEASAKNKNSKNISINVDNSFNKTEKSVQNINEKCQKIKTLCGGGANLKIRRPTLLNECKQSVKRKPLKHHYSEDLLCHPLQKEINNNNSAVLKDKDNNVFLIGEDCTDLCMDEKDANGGWTKDYIVSPCAFENTEFVRPPEYIDYKNQSKSYLQFAKTKHHSEEKQYRRRNDSFFQSNINVFSSNHSNFNSNEKKPKLEKKSKFSLDDGLKSTARTEFPKLSQNNPTLHESLLSHDQPSLTNKCQEPLENTHKTPEAALKSTNSSFLKDQVVSFFQPSDNKLAIKLFGNQNALNREKLRQKQAGHWIIHPCSSFRYHLVLETYSSYRYF